MERKLSFRKKSIRVGIGIIIICGMIGIIFRKTIIHAIANPVVNSVVISEESFGSATPSINLTDNGVKNVYVHGTFTDEDGCANVRDGGNIAITLYRSSVSTTSSCVAENHYCYKAVLAHDCTIQDCSAGTETTVPYQCLIPLEYYTDATDVGEYMADNWIAYTEITDADMTSGSNTSFTEINSMTALRLEGTIQYGTLSFLATSTQQMLYIKNTGNTSIDITIDGGNMLCSSGSIPVENQRYSTVTGTDYFSMVSVTTSSTLVDLNLTKFQDRESTTTLYFQLAMPSSGAAGVCRGANNISAVSQ